MLAVLLLLEWEGRVAVQMQAQAVQQHKAQALSHQQQESRVVVLLVCPPQSLEHLLCLLRVQLQTGRLTQQRLQETSTCIRYELDGIKVHTRACMHVFVPMSVTSAAADMQVNTATPAGDFYMNQV